MDPRERVGSDEKLAKINYSEIKSDLYFSTLNFDDLKFPHEDTKAEIFEESFDGIKDEIFLHGRESIDSIAVPCIMDEDDDFYENRFTPEPQNEDRPNTNDSISLEKRAKSQNNLSIILKENHFHEKPRKQSLKCDTNSY